ncbi:unnamed protein product [Paramecium octaurelia]|uniref:Tetratricopeptide repeat protein n=1 Tax=Paramecium octaurelia TaxID=43137 RepID=A0A8S1YT41_PAROT|nr:unnamed protein product [Paramecium octaurelia]
MVQQGQLIIKNHNLGLALQNMNKQQEAIECFDKAIAINPNNDNAWNNKGFALHNLQQYNYAILCYDQALYLQITSSRLRNKADSLFQFGKKSEAKQFYQAALEKGSNEKTYIQSQLSQL